MRAASLCRGGTKRSARKYSNCVAFSVMSRHRDASQSVYGWQQRQARNAVIILQYQRYQVAREQVMATNMRTAGVAKRVRCTCNGDSVLHEQGSTLSERWLLPEQSQLVQERPCHRLCHLHLLP